MCNEEQLSLYNYLLVEFVHPGRKKKVVEVDLVPFKWANFSKSKQRCEVKYMGPPYTQERSELLQDLVKSLADAPEDWGCFTVELRGQASKYGPIVYNYSKYYSLI